MFIVAVTGGIATGKSTICKHFKKFGISVIDADEIAKSVVEPGTPGFEEIKKYFGVKVIDRDGNLDRLALAEIVFNDPEKRKKLNSITHPRIQREIIFKLLTYFLYGHRYVVMELPLLFEIGTMTKFMHTIITVYCPLNTQIERLLIRNDIDEDLALRRIRCQMPSEEKMSKSHYIIDNTQTETSSRIQTEAIILRLSRSKFPRYFRIAFFTIFMLFLIIIRFYSAFGERKPLTRHVIEDSVKPSIFGAFLYDPVKQDFDSLPDRHVSKENPHENPDDT